MATYDQRHPGRFIKAGEFDGKPVTLTIAAVETTELEEEDGTAAFESIVTFSEKGHGGRRLQFVMNKTNDQCISAMFGENDEGWIGKRITLYPAVDTSGKSASGRCIRVQGSPDIKQPIEATVKLSMGGGRQRKPQKVKLTPTKMGAAEPMFDEQTGEVAGEFDDLFPSEES